MKAQCMANLEYNPNIWRSIKKKYDALKNLVVIFFFFFFFVARKYFQDRKFMPQLKYIIEKRNLRNSSYCTTEFLRLKLSVRKVDITGNEAVGRILEILEKRYDGCVQDFNKRLTKGAIWLDLWNAKKGSIQKNVNVRIGELYRRMPVGEKPDFGALLAWR
jgi:hypothetical protein